MDLKNLKENHTYLIKSTYSSGELESITILTISDKAYKIKRNDNSYANWILKTSLESDNYLVEDITDIVISKQEDFKFSFKYKDTVYFMKTENCKTCGGSGQIPDDKTTSCLKTCPNCNGAGKQAKYVDILFE